jgi:hypothetical protein
VPEDGPSGEEIEQRDIVTVPWNSFVHSIVATDRRYLDQRIVVLDRARDLFRKFGSLDRMELADRQKIAGIRKDRDIDWRLFGAMPAPSFKAAIKNKVRELSSALDYIPFQGAVEKADYLAFVDGYRHAYREEGTIEKGHGLATATRLLSMKRPDYFVCHNSRNEKSLSADFGVKLARHDYEQYWDLVVQKVVSSNWWRSVRPTGGLETSIWDGRAAFLDSLYYVE